MEEYELPIVPFGKYKGQSIYDIDDTLLCEHIVKAGDITITLEGGHGYEIMEDNTMVYEFKTGPYEGQSLDKVFI